MPIGSSTSGSQISSCSLHGSEGYGAARRDRMGASAATPSRSTAKSRRRTSSGSAVAIWTLAAAPAIDASPSTNAVRHRPCSDAAATCPQPRSGDREQRRRLRPSCVRPSATRSARRGARCRPRRSQRAARRRAQEEREDDGAGAHPTSSQTPIRSGRRRRRARVPAPRRAAGSSSRDRADRRGQTDERGVPTSTSPSKRRESPATAVIPIARATPGRDLAVEAGQEISSGTITSPPPTPKRALNRPATSPIPTSFSGTARILGPWTATAHSRGSPRIRSAAILLDVDGVLAPIVDVPHEAVVPEGRGRSCAGSTAATPSSPASAALGRGRAADRRARRARLRRRARPRARAGGGGLERAPAGLLRASTGTTSSASRSTISLHYRRAEDEEEALTMLNAVATRARHEGLVARFGRKVLELRPGRRAQGHSGRASARRARPRARLYAGDDTTDLDAFNASRRSSSASRSGRPKARAARGRRHRGRRPRRAAGAAGLALGDGNRSGLAGRRDLFLPDQHQRRDDPDERDPGTDPERELEARRALPAAPCRRRSRSPSG